ncbi:DUF2637 domain-containing protein [Streptomyces sp. NPDC057301]|uniref:DUF2637 domain-containing protein n=1 Tax=Streptomyces sp. NPDC057301 TaxID=3346093 RepID=UPI0036403B92
MLPSPSSGSYEQPIAGRGPGRRRVKWWRGRKAAFGAIGFGSIIIATVGFVGSYEAVRRLAEEKGFGWFAQVFPLGIDIGIAVLLSLDLALTWINLKWAPLRYIAWVLTGATVVFNSAASWPDLLGSAMHGVIPLLFIAVVEAVRNAIAKATAMEDNQHMDSIRLSRWLLAPVPTFLLWRRMKLWELRSYEAVIKLEQERMVYQARLEARYGRRWRRKAPVEALMPLRLSQYGVPLAETAPAGLAAAGIEPIAVPAPSTAEPHRLDPGPQPHLQASVPELETAVDASDSPRRNEAEESVPLAPGGAAAPAPISGQTRTRRKQTFTSLTETSRRTAESTWLSNLPRDTPISDLVRLAKVRWRIEHDYRELKHGLGLDHFEGRSWPGWHHHVTLVTAAHAFLTEQRLSPKVPRPASPSIRSSTPSRTP